MGGRFRLVNDVHPKRKKSPIEVTLDERFRLVNDVHPDRKFTN